MYAFEFLFLIFSDKDCENICHYFCVWILELLMKGLQSTSYEFPPYVIVSIPFLLSSQGLSSQTPATALFL